MSQAIINFKTDVSLKKEAKKVADSMGLNFSIILNNYLRKFVNEGAVSFESEYTPNKKTTLSLNNALTDIKNRKNISKTFSNIDDLVKSLEA